ncbi:hypothetical protein PTKIN_Ptkin01aG0317400 [Pterospermum kingtungense]
MKEKEMEVQKKVKQKVLKPRQLSGDVMLDIFLRLSAKDLYRFSCVSKDFLSYVSSPCFHQLRTSINPLVDRQGQAISQFTQEIEIDSTKDVVLVPSHHNLVCVVTTNHTYICDPSKQEFVELPKIRSDLFSSESIGVGFGYLPSKNEYKVGRCFFRGDFIEDIYDVELGCEILTISNYRSGTNSSIADSCSGWRVLEEGPPHLTDSNPALVNGSVHWKIEPRRAEEADEYIMSFNLETEKFWILPPSTCVKADPHSFYLVELKEKLWVNHLEDVRLQVMDMWVLKDYDKFTWVKEYSIDFNIVDLSILDKNIRRDGGFHYYKTTEVLNIRDEELLIMMSAKAQVYYNLRTKSFRDLRWRDDSFGFCYYTDEA